MAESHGWDLEGIEVREMLPAQDALEPDEQYTMFHPSEVELGETTLRILADVDRIKPTRVVFDSLSELRLLAGGSLRYRRQILALKQFFAGRQCTVLLLDDLTATRAGPAGAEHRARGDPAGAAQPRLRRGAPAAGGHQVPRQRVPRRLPRLQDRARRAAGVSAAGGGGAHAAADADAHAQRPGGARRPAGRRHRAGHQHAVRGRAGHGQVERGGAVRDRRGAARRARGALHLRRERQHAAHALQGHWAWTSGPFIDSGPHPRAPGRPGGAVARRVRRTQIRAGRRAARRDDGGDRQPERLPQRHAGRALPHRPAARAADLPRPARRGHAC